jgi:hypothetical protein
MHKQKDRKTPTFGKVIMKTQMSLLICVFSSIVVWTPALTKVDDVFRIFFVCPP